MNDKKIIIDHFYDQNHTYLEILTWYRGEIGWFLNPNENSIHTVPFILTCAAALECSLNDYFIKHFIDSYGSHGKLQIPGLLSMSLKGKLINIVPFLTSNKFIINVENKVYQILADLISVRNRLVHNKSSYESHEGTIKEDPDGKPYIVVPEQLQKRLSGEIDPTLGVQGDIGRYHDSLEDLHEKFFDIYKEDNFVGNELIVAINDGDSNYDVNLIIKD